MHDICAGGVSEGVGAGCCDDMSCYVHVMSCEASPTAMMPVDLVAMLGHVRVDMPPVIVAIKA